MNKENILKEIKKALGNPAEGRNSMGTSEAYYDSYYMVGKCFTEEELGNIDLAGLENLIKLADFASEVFY